MTAMASNRADDVIVQIGNRDDQSTGLSDLSEGMFQVESWQLLEDRLQVLASFERQDQ